MDYHTCLKVYKDFRLHFPHINTVTMEMLSRYLDCCVGDHFFDTQTNREYILTLGYSSEMNVLYYLQEFGHEEDMELPLWISSTIMFYTSC